MGAQGNDERTRAVYVEGLEDLAYGDIVLLIIVVAQALRAVKAGVVAVASEQ